VAVSASAAFRLQPASSMETAKAHGNSQPCL